MQIVRTLFVAGFLVLSVFSVASGEGEKNRGASSNQAVGNQSATTNQETPNVEDEPQTWIHLADGRRLQVAEVRQDSDGFWFRVGNVTTFVDRKRVVRVERVSSKKPEATNDPLRGPGNWKISEAAKVENFFQSKFGRRLPLSTIGQSNLHTRWGYDHRNGMDVGLHPDSVEGRGLIEFLRSEEIPFLAFRGAVPGISTGPHIHIGNPSRRLSLR